MRMELQPRRDGRAKGLCMDVPEFCVDMATPRKLGLDKITGRHA